MSILVQFSLMLIISAHVKVIDFQYIQLIHRVFANHYKKV
jgi:hypothetical protein